MSPIECAATQPVAQIKCNPTPRPSPSPSVAGIEYELKDLAVADDGNILDRSDRDAELTDSMLVTKRSKSRATEYTTSSFDMLSDFGAAADTDYAVNGAGAAFHEIPTPQMEDEPILSTYGNIKK